MLKNACKAYLHPLGSIGDRWLITPTDQPKIIQIYNLKTERHLNVFPELSVDNDTVFIAFDNSNRSGEWIDLTDGDISINSEKIYYEVSQNPYPSFSIFKKQFNSYGRAYHMANTLSNLCTMYQKQINFFSPYLSISYPDILTKICKDIKLSTKDIKYLESNRNHNIELSSLYQAIISVWSAEVEAPAVRHIARILRRNTAKSLKLQLEDVAVIARYIHKFVKIIRKNTDLQHIWSFLCAQDTYSHEMTSALTTYFRKVIAHSVLISIWTELSVDSQFSNFHEACALRLGINYGHVDSVMLCESLKEIPIFSELSADVSSISEALCYAQNNGTAWASEYHINNSTLEDSLINQDSNNSAYKKNIGISALVGNLVSDWGTDLVTPAGWRRISRKYLLGFECSTHYKENAKNNNPLETEYSNNDWIAI